MVVEADIGFAPIEDVLIAYLETNTDLPGDTVLPGDEVGEGFLVNRVGGEDDGITDYPRVEVTWFAHTRAREQQLGEQGRQLLLVLGGQAVTYDGGEHRVIVDFCATDTPPDSVPYENPDRRRNAAYYRAGLRRPLF